MALGLFAAAAALAVVRPNLDTEPPAVYQARQTISLPNPFPEPAFNFSAPFISETQIRRGDTLAALLQRLNVQEPKLQPFLVHDKNARSIYKLYPGRTIQAALNQDGELEWLRYYHTPGATEGEQFVSKWLEVQPDANGGFVAAEHSQVAETQVRIAESEITSSLFGATDAANIPDAITLQMADILGSKIDFLTDLRQGDRFSIVYETHLYNGRQIGSGRVLGLEFKNKGKSYEAVWFKPKQSSGSYYDFDGRSLKGAFLRNSLKFSRISSTFGMRKHPVHGVWRGHKGVDYAAQSGTPIHATADGVVDFIGKQNGYGNVIILKHHNQYSTLYAHQRAFAKGLKKGDHVDQGQLIGYVGATGWATGPHLHYEFRVANRPIDPLSVDLPIARKLEGSDQKEFQHTMASYQQQVQWLAQWQDEKVQLASR
ncbi:MAG TPA: M23 family metallopeptidase [Eoetvoesiella sp.]